jgi:hypothetical protein
MPTNKKMVYQLSFLTRNMAANKTKNVAMCSGIMLLSILTDKPWHNLQLHNYIQLVPVRNAFGEPAELAKRSSLSYPNRCSLNPIRHPLAKKSLLTEINFIHT